MQERYGLDQRRVSGVVITLVVRSPSSPQLPSPA